MKKLYLLVIIVLVSVKGFSQGSTMPTMREMYNYAVGDTFEYYTDYYSAGFSYATSTSINVYTSRVDYGNDSIVYGYTYFTIDTTFPGGGSTPTVTTNQKVYTYAIVFLDSSCFYNIIRDTFYTVDTTDILVSAHDTSYEISYHYPYDQCYSQGYPYNSILTETDQFEIGIGILYETGYTDCTNNVSQLIYYHKANGQQSGTPHDFSVGVKDLAKNNLVRLFPNPASANFQLQFSEQPVAETYLQIYDGLGRLVKEEKIPSLSNEINRGNMVNGIYFWQVISKNQVVQRGKLILQ